MMRHLSNCKYNSYIVKMNRFAAQHCFNTLETDGVANRQDLDRKVTLSGKISRQQVTASEFLMIRVHLKDV